MVEECFQSKIFKMFQGLHYITMKNQMYIATNDLQCACFRYEIVLRS